MDPPTTRCAGGAPHRAPAPADYIVLVTMGGITKERPVCAACLRLLRNIHTVRPIVEHPA